MFVYLCAYLSLSLSSPDAVLFPTMYDMFVVMLESWKHGCFFMIGFVAGGEEEKGEGGEGEKRL